MSARQRRRRRARGSSAMAGDPLDLFLDAITNTLGVVMFILLMVVLFGRAGEEHSTTPTSASELRAVEQLEEERRALEAKVRALSPAGDPELAARWLAASERLDRLTAQVRQSPSVERERATKQEEQAQRASAAQQALESAQAELTRIRASDPPRRPGFVRVSRFQADERAAVILALSQGRLSRIRATAQTEAISAPTAGTPITSVEQAATQLRQLLAGMPPITHRVELLVWQGSFTQAKLVEQALLDLGYDSNPMPIIAGKAITPGAGGVQ